MSFSIIWHRSPRQIADRIFDDVTMTYVHSRLRDYCSDYVPMDSGMLDDNVDITPECVHYKSPYAHFQWEGFVFVDERGSTYALPNHSKHATQIPLQHSTDQHALATSHWEAAAMSVHKGDLCRDIEAYLRER